MTDAPNLKLRTARQAANLSLKALGVATGYDKGYLSKIERGLKPATRETIIALCRELPGLEPNDFFEGFSATPTEAEHG